MKALLWLSVCLISLGCEMSPVVSSDTPNTRYDDCRSAARDYCEHVVQPGVDEMDHCVAAHAFECVSAASGVPSARPQT